MGTTCEIRTAVPLLQPQLIHGVYEYPVTFFEDRPGHSRHAEIRVRVLSAEMEFMLLQAHKKKVALRRYCVT